MEFPWKISHVEFRKLGPPLLCSIAPEVISVGRNINRTMPDVSPLSQSMRIKAINQQHMSEYKLTVYA